MVFAWALALAGIDQIEAVREEKLSVKPSTMREMLAYERATGRIYQQEREDDEADTLDILSQQQLVREHVTPAKIPRR